MENQVKVSRLSKIPAWILALIIAAISIICTFLFEYVPIADERYIGIIGFLLLIPVASLIICMIHPRSVKYTPFICNPVAVLGTIFHPLAWTTLSEYLIFVGSLALSILGAIIGSKIGKRKLTD